MKRIENFKTTKAYVESLKKDGIPLDEIDPKLITYLWQHCAMRYIMVKNPEIRKSMYLRHAFAPGAPFELHKTAGFMNCKSTLTEMKKRKYDYIKLWKGDRQCLESIDNAEELLRRNEAFSQKKNTDVLVVTYETVKDHKHLGFLVKSLHDNKYSYEILGQGEKWEGFMVRLKSYEKFLRTLDPEKVVVLCDARDVIVNLPSDVLLRRFQRHRKPGQIIYGGEFACCISGIPNEVKKFMKDRSGGFALNAGLAVGLVKDFILLFEGVFKSQKGNDDQVNISNYWYQNPNVIMLDREEHFFSNSFAWGSNGWDGNAKCKYKLNQDGIITSDNTGNTPCFIQTPAKHWSCYHKLVQMQSKKV